MSIGLVIACSSIRSKYTKYVIEVFGFHQDFGEHRMACRVQEMRHSGWSMKRDKIGIEKRPDELILRSAPPAGLGIYFRRQSTALPAPVTVG